ncbi:MAG: hypothetical protein ACD_78C00422G0005 [uncultured bacterium (gcode 4)]|uniref:Uncharacterized protein n=1 Tax=uncultured bacterium (gcode 4) TaxID=1234023 RepID=K1XVX0_9BACT|nr:MAG: hypothetical protein ACD_78C00422G0005 [uncultured bacterium (gcode 4)]
MGSLSQMPVLNTDIVTQTNNLRGNISVSAWDIQRIQDHIDSQRLIHWKDYQKDIFESWESAVKESKRKMNSWKTNAQVQSQLAIDSLRQNTKKDILNTIEKDVITSCDTLYEYNKHPDLVKSIQKLLILQWYAIKDDWVYGNITKEAIKRLQAELSKIGFYKSKIDGAFGKATYDAYNDYLGCEKASPVIVWACDNNNCEWSSLLDTWLNLGNPSLSRVCEPLTQVKPEPPVIEVLKNKTMSAIFKDGAYYLTGPKGNKTRVDFETLSQTMGIPKEAPTNLQKSVWIVNDFSELLDAYLVKYPDKNDKYEAVIKTIQNAFTQSDIQLWRNIINIENVVDLLFRDIISVNNSGINNYNKKIKRIFNNLDPKVRHAEIMQFIRKDLNQYDMVARSIMNRHEKTFWIDDNKIMNGDLSWINLDIKKEQKVMKIIDEAKILAAKNWAKHKTEYIAAFQKQNPWIPVNEKNTEEWNRKLTILVMTKKEVFYQKLYNMDQSNPELKVLQDILGAGTFDMSDRAVDITWEVASMIVIEAIAIGAGMVTAWLWTAAVNAALLGRNAYRWVRAAKAYNMASKTRQVMTTAGRILGAWVGFEAGAATTRSFIENGDLTSMHSKEWYMQSIAMMWVLRWVGKLIETGKFGTGIQFKEGAWFTKNILPFTWQVSIEGTALFGMAGIVGEIMIDWRDNWTPEQLAQALLMAALFKGASRIKIWKPPVIPVDPVTPSSPKIQWALRVSPRMTTIEGKIRTALNKTKLDTNKKNQVIIMIARWEHTKAIGIMKDNWTDLNGLFQKWLSKLFNNHKQAYKEAVHSETGVPNYAHYEHNEVSTRKTNIFDIKVEYPATKVVNPIPKS